MIMYIIIYKLKNNYVKKVIIKMICRQIISLPSLEYLNECFEPDFENGILVWKERPREHFNSEHGYRAANKRFVGKRAGSLHKTRGHTNLRLNYKIYFLHRVIFYMYHKEELSNGLIIDHIDGNRQNNSIHNLRLTNHIVNNRNRIMNSNNTTGYTGVRKVRRKFVAYIKVNGKYLSLGSFETKEEAYEARLKKQNELGYYTERHGLKGA